MCSSDLTLICKEIWTLLKVKKSLNGIEKKKLPEIKQSQNSTEKKKRMVKTVTGKNAFHSIFMSIQCNKFNPNTILTYNLA